jgi:hypothetical protein
MSIKVLSTRHVCVLFEINAPIWNGGKRVVGLAEHRLQNDNEIHFTYVRKRDGQLSFPDKYYFDGRKLKDIDFVRQNVRGTTLILVPFTELDIIERRDTPEPEVPPTPEPTIEQGTLFDLPTTPKPRRTV